MAFCLQRFHNLCYSLFVVVSVFLLWVVFGYRVLFRIFFKSSSSSVEHSFQNLRSLFCELALLCRCQYIILSSQSNNIIVYWDSLLFYCNIRWMKSTKTHVTVSGIMRKKRHSSHLLASLIKMWNQTCYARLIFSSISVSTASKNRQSTLKNVIKKHLTDFRTEV